MKEEPEECDSNPFSNAIHPRQWPPGLSWDTELEALKPLLLSVADRIDQILECWYAAYSAYLDDRPTLPQAEFVSVFKPHLAESLNALSGGRTRDYGARIASIGAALAQREVPFAEVLLSVRTCEEALANLFSDLRPVPQVSRSFSKFSTALQAALAEGYFRAFKAGTTASNKRFTAPGANEIAINAIVGSSLALRKLRERIKAAARVRGTLLLVGESGTGKELVAGAIHRSSPAPDTPFIAVNCAAIPRDLIESELFGYRKGAFSGANSHFLGLFRSAESGTLFLDEVTEMSPETQSKILRAIQERTVRPLGSTTEIPIDVRLIASTNRDPEEAVRSGQLRHDLYYRLQANVLYVPPLRERIEDVPLLVEHFIGLFNARMGRQVAFEGIQPEALQAMLEYSWPGNVRELSNAIETAMTFGRGPLVALEDLPAAITRRSAAAETPGAPPEPPPGPALQFTTLQASERELVARALAATGGNKTRAAKLLQISRKKLYSLTTKYML